MTHMPTTQQPARHMWASVTDAAYGVLGNGTNEHASLQAALTANAGRGLIIPPGTYRFDSTLAIPAHTHVELWPGTTLECRVTGGGDGITLADGAKLYSVGGGSAAAVVRAHSSCNIDSLIANADKLGGQEFFFVAGLFITAQTGATIAKALVNMVSLFVNSGLRDLVVECNYTAPNGIRIAGGTVTGFGPVYVEDCWVTTGKEHNILITENNPSTGSGSAWLTNVTSENQASGYNGLHIKGYGGLYDIRVRNYHYENGVTAAATTSGVYLDGCPGFQLDGMDFLSSGANKRGIYISSSGRNFRTSIRNVQNVNNQNPVLVDDLNVVTFTNRMIGFYETADSGTSTGSSDQMFTHLVQMPGGLSTKTVAGAVSDSSWPATYVIPNGTIAVDTTNSKIYVRIGGVWKSVTVS